MTICIRAADPRRDAAPVQRIYAEAVVSSPATFELSPPTVATMWQRIEDAQREHRFLVATRDGACLGFATSGAHRARAGYRGAVETSVYVTADARRGGVGIALYRALLRELLDLGFRRALASVTLPNEPAVRLHETLGFAHVGVFTAVGFKLGAWHDVSWWQRPLELTTAVPRPAATPDGAGERAPRTGPGFAGVESAALP
ncbi:GNAT family N-acetyltransferase [Egicoccus halophilus]|uniref:N-acetyltransferase n=1 Tax=Egicoccus halophilus TaxID=1670830 RepID=A0A8J3AB98_9ACTN|nr:GNAT family N-acetyltransferase [Egicoccus halophilus]GGI09445.1 N-acetyltransferase [Egicoccus halophilus]